MAIHKIKIFSGRGSEYLAQKIAASFGTTLGQSEVLRFSDGEFQPSYNESIRGCTVFIIQSTFPPSDNLMELLMMIDAARRAGNCGQGVYEEESVKIAAPPTKNGWGRYFCRDVGARHAWPGRARQTSSYGKAAGRACPAPTIKSDGNAPTPSPGRLS